MGAHDGKAGCTSSAARARPAALRAGEAQAIVRGRPSPTRRACKRRRSSARQGPGARREACRDRRAAAAAPSRAGLRRPRRDHRLAAGVGRQRQRHLRPARSARSPRSKRVGPAAASDGRACAPAGCRRRRSARCARSPRRSRDGGSISPASRRSTPRTRIKALVAVKGIGPWTADIFLLFCLGHPDAFPAGDLALQEAAKLALGLKTRPDAARLERIAERWRPWRGVAARMLWAYYRGVEGAFGDGPRRRFRLSGRR